MRLKPIPPARSELLFFPESDSEYIHFEDAHDHPFDHTAQGFSPVNAWWLADAALLAYWDEGPAREIWNRAGLQFEFFSRDGAQCHIGWTDTFVIVAFRGTQLDEWHDLFDIVKISLDTWELGGKVHTGFLDAHNRIWPDVEKKLEALDPARRAVWFTGHSMGAALATLSMDRMGSARGVYTIGSPPVGNRRFARQFNRRHAGRSFRYVNHRDIVVLPRFFAALLGGYRHVELRNYIDAKGRISRTWRSVARWASLVRTRGSARRMPRLRDSESLPLLPGFLIDHTPRRYAVYIWNDLAGGPPRSGAAWRA